MRKSVILKNFIRRPVKSVLLLGVLTLAVFLFGVRVAEYGGLHSGSEKLSDYYKPVGRLLALNGDTLTEAEPAIDILNKEKTVDFVDAVQELPATLQDTYTPDNDGYGIPQNVYTIKEASVLRLLGTEKIKTELLICTEKIFVCLTGALLGISAVTAFLGNIEGHFYAMAVVLLFLEFAACIVTETYIVYRRPLQLIQVKE